MTRRIQKKILSRIPYKTMKAPTPQIPSPLRTQTNLQSQRERLNYLRILKRHFSAKKSKKWPARWKKKKQLKLRRSKRPIRRKKLQVEPLPNLLGWKLSPQKEQEDWWWMKGVPVKSSPTLHLLGKEGPKGLMIPYSTNKLQETMLPTRKMQRPMMAENPTKTKRNTPNKNNRYSDLTSNLSKFSLLN